MDDQLLNEAGYMEGILSEEFNKRVPNITDEVLPQPNKVVQSPSKIFQCTIVDVNVTPYIDDLLKLLLHGRKHTPKHIQVDESTLFYKVRYLNTLSTIMLHKSLNNILNPNLMLVNANYF